MANGRFAVSFSVCVWMGSSGSPGPHKSAPKAFHDRSIRFSQYTVSPTAQYVDQLNHDIFSNRLHLQVALRVGEVA